MAKDAQAPENGQVTKGDLFRENWEHVRHIENERLGFTSVYMVIVAGVLAFLGQKGLDNEFSYYLVWLLVALSAIGAALSFRLRADMNAHGDKLRALAAQSGLSDYFTFGAESGWTCKIKLRTLFPAIYLVFTLCFSVFVAVLHWQASQPQKQAVQSVAHEREKTDSSSGVSREPGKAEPAKSRDEDKGSANKRLQTDASQAPRR